MEIRDYQQWLQEWDRARGWDRVDPAHTLVHALEEMGEVARLVLQWEGYKEAGDPVTLQGRLAEELSDLLVFVFKLACQTGVDLQDALIAGQAKAELRYPDAGVAAADLARYRQRQAQINRETEET
jgi:dCTP diphosphatase